MITSVMKRVVTYQASSSDTNMTKNSLPGAGGERTAKGKSYFFSDQFAHRTTMSRPLVRGVILVVALLFLILGALFRGCTLDIP